VVKGNEMLFHIPTEIVNISSLADWNMSGIKKSEESNIAEVEKGLFEGLIEALSDKHSQLDLNFQKVSFRLPGVQQIGLELNGTVTLSVHMRELTGQEKEALAAKNVSIVASK
jgi:hypothetical protein